MRVPSSAAAIAIVLGYAAAAQAAPHFVAPQANALADGSFETPALSTGQYVYSDAGSSWSFSGALVNAQSNSAWYGGAAPGGVDGSQFLALQGNSALAQSFTATAATMQLSWLAAGRPNYGTTGGAQTYAVQVDSATVASGATQDGSGFRTQTATLNGLTPGQAYSLSFQGLATTDQTTFIDRIALGSGIEVLQNGGFEAQALAPGQYSYVQQPDDWTGGGALVNAQTWSAWYGGTAPGGFGGNQFYALQATSSLSQSFHYSGGNLDLGWLSGGRAHYGCCNGNQSYDVLIDDVVLGSFSTVDSQAFTQIRQGIAGLDVGDHLLTFRGLSTSDNTAFLDDISLTGRLGRPGDGIALAVPEPASWALMLGGFGMVGAAMRSRRKSAVGFG
jgi:hypothetical protein